MPSRSSSLRSIPGPLNSNPPNAQAPTGPTHDHAPAHPSGLRQSYTVSSSYSSTSDFERDGDEDSGAGPSNDNPVRSVTPNERTGLLSQERGHGTFTDARTVSPSNASHADSLPGFPFDAPTDTDLDFSPYNSESPNGEGPASGKPKHKRKSWKRQISSHITTQKMHTSRDLARRHGVKDTPGMYLSYYLPVLVWAREYSWSYFKGDFIAALTVAGMYVPMALSLADNLAHVPAINGLYSFVWNPLIYALLGSCPALIVGPEAAGSLLVGAAVKSSVDLGRGGDEDRVLHAKICGIVAGMAGAMVFAAGVARLGFLDSVLSRPFLRGFISAIGVVIAVDQLIPELGLNHLVAKHPGIGHGSSVEKLRFILGNLDKVHKLTAVVAGTSFVVIMVCREIKRRMQPRYPGVAYVPDRFLVVVLTSFLAYWFQWDKKGVAVLGTVEAASHQTFKFRWPFQPSNMQLIRDTMGTSFLIALLGFFESSVAAKSLSSNEPFAGIQLSANRELVALGVANFVGGCFMSLPAFGGYGRSKVNKATGGKTPMSSILLSLLTLFTILFLLPYLYYLPKPVLSALISVVAWSLIEECPHDITFFLRLRAWPELALMAIILLSTIFFSLTLGMAIGVGLSLLQVIRNATRPRIQILGRIPGTNRFENAEFFSDSPNRLEFVEGCLIVKIPEPLTFANTGELKSRLRRLERYGTNEAHPALPRLRQEDSNKNIIFDVHGVASMDGSGTQVLEEIVRGYRERGVRVFFSRVPGGKDSEVWKMMKRSGIVDLVGGEGHFVSDVGEALKMTEVEQEE
ncbi:sulfate transporter family-domain-containing protein [Neurospora crassa]|nr:sulfate transporter family-domain-containing protein [Neurospora crassa]